MKRTAKKLLGIFLAVVLVVSMLPVGTVALAADAPTEALTFFSDSDARVDVNAISAYTHASTSGNWMFFDWSGDWAEKTIRKTGENNENQIRLRAGGTTYKSWLALKIDFETLTTGKYSLSMSYNSDEETGTNGGTPSATFWFAKADSSASAADYKTEANLLGTVTSFSGSNVLGEDIVIDDLDSEYVLVMEFESDIRLNVTNFTFTRTGDLPTGGDTPEEEYATEETFTFANASDDKYIYNDLYKDYGATNPNWAYFDRSDDYKAETFIESTDGIGGLLRRRSSEDEYALRIKDGTASADAWVALKLKSTNPLKTGKYSLTFDLKNVYEGFNGNARQAAVYLAEYDATQNSGSYYKTTENCIRSLERISAGDEVSIGSFYVEDSNAEYVLIIEIEGAELYLQDFMIKWEEDLPTVELATEETFSFRNGLKSGYTLEDNYNEYNSTTNPNWRFFDKSDDYDAYPDYTQWAGYAYESPSYIGGASFVKIADAYKDDGTVDVADAWTALELDPASNLKPGKYQLSFDLLNVEVAREDDRTDKKMAVYLAEYVAGNNDGEYYKTPAHQVMPLTKVNTNKTVITVNAPFEFYITDPDAKYVFIIELEGAEIWLTDFKLTRTGELSDAEAEVIFSKNPLRLGEIGGASLAIDGSKIIASNITYSKKSGDAVEISTTGVITPKKAGEATITATYGDITADATITVLTDELLSGTVSVYVTSLVNGVASKTGIDGIALGNINAVARGKEITLTASGIDETKEFSHWQTASGTFLSDTDTYTFKANANIAIFGVYENVAEATEGEKVTVSFYDGFGGRIAQVTKATATTFADFAAGVAHEGYRGYLFSCWESIEKVLEATDAIKRNTIAVAQYEEEPQAKYTVTVDGEEYGKGNYAYDEEVSVTSDAPNFLYWTRDNEIVSYNPTYIFNVWGDTDLEEVTGDEAVVAAPAVILASDAADGSYMVEYSLPAGYEFVEAGIVFSNSGTPSVRSCSTRASSKNLEGLHGQFTAKPSGSETKARGYVIYKDADGDLIASYAD